MLCSCVGVSAGWGAAHTVYGHVTVDGQPEPNIQVQSQAWYGEVRQGLPSVMTDAEGYYTIEVSEVADRLNVFIAWPAQFQFTSVAGGDDWWQKSSENTIGVIFDSPATGWLGPANFAATWVSVPTNTPAPTNTTVPTSIPASTNTPVSTSTMVPTNTPVPTGLATCTPWPTLMPLAQMLIDGVNTSRNRPVVIIWGSPLQLAAYSHYEFLAMSPEIRVEHGGVDYVAQGWYGGVFYYAENQPDTIYYITWFGSGGVVDPCLTYVDTDQGFKPLGKQGLAAVRNIPDKIGRPTIRIPTPTPGALDTLLGVAQAKLRSTWRMEGVIYFLAVVFVGGFIAMIALDKKARE